ncbi:hypothetical protein MNBD_ACTINO01-741, partial [hydrothermal vent metagenome]
GLLDEYWAMWTRRYAAAAVDDSPDGGEGT